MIKFAAILLFVIGAFDSTAGIDNATWLEYNCNEPEFDGLWRNNIRQMLVYNNQLYFLFENYVVRMDLPEYEFNEATYPINETVATTGRLDNLWFRRPRFLYYSTLTSRPMLLGLNDATGHFLSRPQEMELDENDKIFVIRESSSFAEEYVMKFNQIRSGGETLFALGPETQNPIMQEIIKKEKLQLGYTRQDPGKIMNLKYDRNFAYFVLLDKDGKLDSQMNITLVYRPKYAVYYEINETDTEDPLLKREPFEAFLFEIEFDSTIGSLVHLHRVKLGPDHLQPNPDSYKILKHYHFQLSLEEFLDCPIAPIAVKQLKGVAVTQIEHEVHFYLFINDWYYKTTDLFKVKFKLEKHFKWRENARKVLLPDGTPYEDRPFEERLTLKYIKQYSDYYYITWDNQKTYHLNWVDQNRPDELLWANELPMYEYHKCAHQVLTLILSWMVFCFERQYYYYFGNGGEDTVPYHEITRYPIASIFEDTDFKTKWNNEDLQAMFLYTHWNENETYLIQEYVWMTYNVLYKFEAHWFTVVIPDKKNKPWDRQVRVNPDQAKNIPPTTAGAWPNCLFKRDCEPGKEIDDLNDINDPSSKRGTVGTSLMAILLLLILIAVFLFTLWVVVDVKVKTNVAFLDDLRTIIRKKIIYPPDSAEKGEHKPGELKSVKSTSSLGATTKRKSLQSLGEAKTGAEAKSGGSPKAKLAGKKSAEKLAGKKSAEKLAGKKSAEKLAGKKSAEKLADKKSAEKLTSQKSPEKLAGKKSAEKVAGKKSAEKLTSKK